MSRAFAIIGGLLFVSSLLFFAVSFTWWFDGAQPWSWVTGWRPTFVDVVLFTVFALHHSLFARTGIKGWIVRMCPPELERSMYVWVASLLFLFVCGCWQPVPGALWRVSGAAAAAMWAAQFAGVILTLVAARRLDPLELAGVRQVEMGVILDNGPFGVVRHPIYLGWWMMVWLTPAMNGTRLVFAITSCIYLLVAIPFEERDLRRTFGSAYEEYMRRVRWKVFPGVY